MNLPGGNEPGMVGFAVCWSGPPNGLENALAPIRRMGTPLADVAPIDYVALQRSGDIDDPRARADYLKSGFIAKLPSDLITALTEGLVPAAGRNTSMFIQSGGGAIGRVSNDATAFPQRDALGNLGVDWAVGDDSAAHVAWIREFWTRVEPITQGFYANDGDPDVYTQPAIASNYRGNFDRLVAVSASTTRTTCSA